MDSDAAKQLCQRAKACTELRDAVRTEKGQVADVLGRMMFQMDSLKETVEANTIQMRSLSGKVNGFHGKVHTLTRETKSLNGKVDGLKTSLGEEQKKSTALEKKSTALEDRVNDLGAEGVDLQTQVSSLRHDHLVYAKPALCIGLGQLRYDFLKKLRDYPTRGVSLWTFRN